MSIKQEIGSRITQARKQLGFTIKELSDRTGSFSSARISNWEHGSRSPGPEEAKVLADKLDVSASYLLCLTDDPRGQWGGLKHPIPLVDTALINEFIKQLNASSLESQTVDDRIAKICGNNAFAIEVSDTSMEPELKRGDFVIFDSERKARPGLIVLAYLPAENEYVLRRYSEAQNSESDDIKFSLIPLNKEWRATEVKESEAEIIATAVEHRRLI